MLKTNTLVDTSPAGPVPFITSFVYEQFTQSHNKRLVKSVERNKGQQDNNFKLY